MKYRLECPGCGQMVEVEVSWDSGDPEFIPEPHDQEDDGPCYGGDRAEWLGSWDDYLEAAEEADQDRRLHAYLDGDA